MLYCIRSNELNGPNWNEDSEYHLPSKYDIAVLLENDFITLVLF